MLHFAFRTAAAVLTPPYCGSGARSSWRVLRHQIAPWHPVKLAVCPPNCTASAIDYAAPTSQHAGKSPDWHRLPLIAGATA